jgi:hypothetical protein
MMSEVISFEQYKKEREERELKIMLIKKMSSVLTKHEADYTFLQILDLFCQKYYPDIYWQFDLFINDKFKDFYNTSQSNNNK